MKNRPSTFARSFPRVLACFTLLLAARTSFAQTDQMYFPAVDNVTNALVSKINAEALLPASSERRIDMSAWYLTEHSISIALINAFNKGVQVRLIGDRGSIFEIDQKTKTEFYWLASQGVPIRLRFNPTWFPEIDHWKTTIFKGQRLVAFGSANYTPNQLAPSSATDYSDETVLFTTDSSLVGAFLTKFDQIWNDTTVETESLISGPPYLKNWNDACALESGCSDYRTRYPNPAPMSINTARLEPNNPMPADLIWGQGNGPNDFNTRLVQEINNESSAIKFVIYRLTVDNVTNALLSKFQSGVPMQLIVEPTEYLNRKWPEFWLTHANLDRLWAAGVPIKQRKHNGLTHMKMLVTSRYATNASSNLAAAWQRDQDYFVSASGKPTIYQAMANRFNTMWNDTAGFTNFVPLPPDAPSLSTPVSGADERLADADPGMERGRVRHQLRRVSRHVERKPVVGRQRAGAAGEQPAEHLLVDGHQLARGCDDVLLEGGGPHQRDGQELVTRRHFQHLVVHDRRNGRWRRRRRHDELAVAVAGHRPGSVGAAGSATYTSGTFTVKGSGADIWGTLGCLQLRLPAAVG